MFSVCDTYILRIVVEIKYFPGAAVLNMSVIGVTHPVFLTLGVSYNLGGNTQWSKVSVCHLIPSK